MAESVTLSDSEERRHQKFSTPLDLTTDKTSGTVCSSGVENTQRDSF